MHSVQVDLELFAATYRPVLETLDGSDDAAFVDFFFEPSPMQQGAWMFADEDSRLDFFDLAVDAGVCLTVSEIQAGESNQERSDRDKRSLRRSEDSDLGSSGDEEEDEEEKEEREEREKAEQKQKQMSKKAPAAAALPAMPEHRKQMAAGRIKGGKGARGTGLLAKALDRDSLTAEYTRVHDELAAGTASPTRRKRLRKRFKELTALLEHSV